MPLATHSLLDFHDCDRTRLEERSGLRQAMINAITEAGGTYVTDIFHAFHPHGLSGMIVIAESHVAIHTWPEHRFAAVDIFSCGPKLNQQIIAERLQEWLLAGEVTVDRRERGYGKTMLVEPEGPQG